MGRGYIYVTKELLAKSLHLPKGTDVYGTEWDFSRDAAKIYVCSPDLRNLPEGSTIPQVTYTAEMVSRFYDANNEGTAGRIRPQAE